MMRILKLLFGGAKSSHKVARQTDHNDGYESEWLKWSNDDYSTASDGFVKLSGATDVSVAGTSFRLDDCRVVLSALTGKRGDPSAVNLVRETDNPDHSRAVKVVVKLQHRDVHIGYLPSDISDMIAHKYSIEMPIEGSLRQWGKKKTGDAVFFRICIFAPSAKDRKKFILSNEK
jgi:hypothetical protein